MKRECVKVNGHPVGLPLEDSRETVHALLELHKGNNRVDRWAECRSAAACESCSSPACAADLRSGKASGGGMQR